MRSVSERFYRVLLYLYPADFRRKYGDEMQMVFRDMLRSAQQDGRVLMLWGRTIIDLVPSLLIEHVEQLRDKPMTTMMIDEYEVQAHLENGATSSLYLVKDPTDQRQLIMKLWRPEDSFDPDTLKREVDAMIALKHTRIPQVHRYVSNDAQPYFLMDYIDGATLLQHLQNADDFLDENMLIDWGIQACDILTHLHTHQPQPYLFRDVKPSNFILDKDEQLHIIDFGISVPYTTNQQYDLIGTIGYASPEAYQGTLDPRSDIYGLGATLHHLATRIDPRPEHNPSAQAFTFAPIRSVHDGYSRAFADIVHRATAYEPDVRYQSAEAMKAALETCRLNA